MTRQVTAVRDAAADDGDDIPHAPRPRRVRARGGGRRRWIIASVVVVALATVVLIAATVAPGGAGNPADDATAAALPTSTVERRDMVVTEDFDGDLGFGEPVTLAAGRAGTVTSLPEAGDVVRTGEPVYTVDMEPTVLLPGRVPAYRPLNTDASNGRDIRQLEQALVDLEIDTDLDVDGSFTSATADAVEDWEDELGRADPDGEVELGDVLFGPRSLRVAELLVDVGTQVQAGTPVLTYTPRTKVVSVDLDANRTDLLPLEAEAGITLPDGTQTTGTVTSVGTEAEADPADPQATPTVPVEVAIDDPDAVAAFDTGEVAVTVERSRDEDVLTVPVAALLALSEGGYAVQVADAAASGGYRLVPVDVGSYSDGYVAVSGDGIEEGLDVVVPE